MADAGGGQELPDAQLLQRYVRLRDDDAFAVLVQRYGRLVWSVCRRLLCSDADVEDAFQATFLTLASHAPRIRAGAALASWLYRVAHRIAARAARQRGAWQERQCTAQMLALARPCDDLSGRELQAVVDEELLRLPEKYRTPFLLCCLEGKSKSEAARQLGWKEGTVSGRLAEARKRMRNYLLRRGVAPVAAVTAVALEQPPATAAPHALMWSTIRMAAGAAVGSVPVNVARLAEGACTAMNTKKVIAVCVLVVGGLVAGGVSWLPRTKIEARASAAAPPAEGLPASNEPPPPDPPAPRPPDRLELALRRWHAAMNRVKTATCEVKRTEKDVDRDKVSDFQGTFRYLKKDECWALEMQEKGDRQNYEKIVSAGRDLCWYSAQSKEVRKFERPFGLPLSEMATDPFCALFSGINSAQARERFDWKFVKEDSWYVYLAIEPKKARDRATFLTGRLVLVKDSHLPRQVWFQTPGMEVKWDITKIDTAVSLKKEDFAPKVPRGWRLTVMDRIEVVPGTLRVRTLGPVIMKAEVTPAVVGPGTVNLGTVKLDTTVKRRVVWRAEKPFRITDVKGPDELTCALPQDTTPRKVQAVTLEYQPVKAGRFVHHVRFETDLDEVPVTVVVEGVAKP
jgi:TIGR03009 family protein